MDSSSERTQVKRKAEPEDKLDDASSQATNERKKVAVNNDDLRKVLAHLQDPAAAANKDAQEAILKMMEFVKATKDQEALQEQVLADAAREYDARLKRLKLTEQMIGTAKPEDVINLMGTVRDEAEESLKALGEDGALRPAQVTAIKASLGNPASLIPIRDVLNLAREKNQLYQNLRKKQEEEAARNRILIEQGKLGAPIDSANHDFTYEQRVAQIKAQLYGNPATKAPKADEAPGEQTQSSLPQPWIAPQDVNQAHAQKMKEWQRSLLNGD